MDSFFCWLDKYLSFSRVPSFTYTIFCKWYDLGVQVVWTCELLEIRSVPRSIHILFRCGYDINVAISKWNFGGLVHHFVTCTLWTSFYCFQTGTSLLTYFFLLILYSTLRLAAHSLPFCYLPPNKLTLVESASLLQKWGLFPLLDLKLAVG